MGDLGRITTTFAEKIEFKQIEFGCSLKQNALNRNHSVKGMTQPLFSTATMSQTCRLTFLTVQNCGQKSNGWTGLPCLDSPVKRKGRSRRVQDVRGQGCWTLSEAAFT